MDTAQLKKQYKEQIAPALQKQFNYSSAMQIPVLKKIVINQGLGDATQDKKIIDVAINESAFPCRVSVTSRVSRASLMAVATIRWVSLSRSSSRRSTSTRWTAFRV